MESRRCWLVWTKHSQQHMRAAYKYISRDSMQNAAKVLDDIVTAAEKAITNLGFLWP
jgi:plasmid stabilization system protein ParE